MFLNSKSVSTNFLFATNFKTDGFGVTSAYTSTGTFFCTVSCEIKTPPLFK